MAAMTAREDADRCVDALEARWPELDDLWSGLTERVNGCGLPELEALGELLAAFVADLARERPAGASSPQLPKAGQCIEQYMTKVGCPDPTSICRILNRHGFYYRGRKAVCVGVLKGVIGQMSQAMRPFVAWGLKSPYGKISGADGLAEWAGCRAPLADVLARVRDVSPEVSLAAAREIWRLAVRGEGDLSGFLAAVEDGLESVDPDGPFFLSCARRLVIRRQDPEAVLPPVIPAALSPPAVECRTRTSFTSWDSMNGSGFGSLRQHDDGTHQPHPVSNRACFVCASVEVTCIHCEAWGCNTGRWSLSELECEACGCYSCHNVDD